MNKEDLIRQMQGQFQQQSVLLRKPTDKELDTFIDRVLDEKDEVPYTLTQGILFKLQRGIHSPTEAEILPLVLERMEKRGIIHLNRGER